MNLGEDSFVCRKDERENRDSIQLMMTLSAVVIHILELGQLSWVGHSPGAVGRLCGPKKDKRGKTAYFLALGKYFSCASQTESFDGYVALKK